MRCNEYKNSPNIKFSILSRPNSTYSSKFLFTHLKVFNLKINNDHVWWQLLLKRKICYGLNIELSFIMPSLQFKQFPVDKDLSVEFYSVSLVEKHVKCTWNLLLFESKDIVIVSTALRVRALCSGSYSYRMCI